MLENISFDFDFCFGVCLGFPIMGTCCSDTIFHPGGGSGLPPTFCYKNIILRTVPRFIIRLLDLINTILLEICVFWKMKRIRDEMLGRLAIICRSCWDNAERGGESPRAGGRYGNELRNLSLSNGMLPHSLGHHHCHHHCHHWHHSLRHHHRSLSTYLLEPGVLSRCRLFLNQFETWRIKRFRIVLVLKKC